METPSFKWWLHRNIALWISATKTILISLWEGLYSASISQRNETETLDHNVVLAQSWNSHPGFLFFFLISYIQHNATSFLWLKIKICGSLYETNHHSMKINSLNCMPRILHVVGLCISGMETTILFYFFVWSCVWFSSGYINLTT